MPLEALPHLLEVHEVAYQLKCSQEFVRRLIREGRLVAVPLLAGQVKCPRYRVDTRDLAAYLDACRAAARRPDDDRATPRSPAPAVHPLGSTRKAG
jgi:excisionase family DNA binding protein